ncbi:adenylate cyclase type 3 [Agrilus planipennis]|uniref:adenylate cyclase n=1 Tax=Agrilus planipennis TaxID=224129 RepID=A0A7F5R0L2_AGRPL|nr:adenylate cyclase type 3 [Agrilus planipennis]
MGEKSEATAANITQSRTFLWSSFKDKGVEKLYQSYSAKQKRSGLECFLLAAILFDIYLVAISSGQDFLVVGVMGGFLIANCLLLIWCRRDFDNKTVWAAMPHVSWHFSNAQLIASVFLKRNEVTASESLGWALLLVYLIYLTLPLRLRYCVILSLGTCASYMVVVIRLPKFETHLVQQHSANCVLLITANLLGLMSYFVEEKQQRKAFLETRQSLEMKLVIEEQSAEQERLLLSVLPEHVAVQMRQDLDLTDSQFKKIYMSRHENVSILYADIVGFTAISSTYSAQELVKILNELFARFDKLAEKYHQLRIKILGDCYYCISGAPKERPDHAVLCVHMGLSMVKAIKYVQQTTNSPVDMRVGIHTGAVLAGVLGQRQWQFDVYSKDVELANKMESSGMAGRVHISATTLSFLNGEFEIEPAYGEKREEALRIAGLKTYFIVRVLKPFQPDVKSEIQNGGKVIADEDSCVIADLASESQEDTTDNTHLGLGRKREGSEDFKSRLKKELVSRDGHKELAKNTKFITLSFINPEIDKAYHHHMETFSSVTLQSFLVVRLATGIAQFIVLPRRTMNFLSFIIGDIVFMVISGISLVDFLPKPLCGEFTKCFNRFSDSMLMKQILSLVCIALLTTVNIIDSFSCSIVRPWNENCVIIPEETDRSCMYPSYFSYFAVLILIATSLPASLSYLCKAAIMALITSLHCVVNMLMLSNAFNCAELRRDWPNFMRNKFALSALLVTATFTLVLLARHMEQVARVLFLWRSEVERQKETAADMRRRNEALVYNVLPPHVAAHFMGNRKRSYDELYSQSYAEVGVLFASMPNFSDFYSEETVNNQGLECLRFLNEVISDFDALLEQPQFQDIIKIKTIGSTYMAASGLNPSRQVKPDDPITVRWSHLALLVEFALELKRALQSINEQSFNHFVLKMGVNHGPITAGVIGARKPHYDIWGNTVNVASRMESTGKAGCIQVTEETCMILQHFGYQFEQRGLVAVKGKGQLMTYYLIGKTGKITPPTAPMSPSLGLSGMETVAEEDESKESLISEEKTIIECTIIQRDYRSDEDGCNSDLDVPVYSTPLINRHKEDERVGSENALLLNSESQFIE